MPAEAATNVVNIIQFLYTPQNGSGAYAQHHAHFFGADFIVPLDERDDFCIQIVLSDILTDILRDTVIQVRRNPVLADVFNRLGYMERKGSGFGKILNGYKAQINYTLGDTLRDILGDTVIQVRHNDRKLVAVRTECGTLILGAADS